jgi:hypothetical protein
LETREQQERKRMREREIEMEEIGKKRLEEKKVCVLCAYAPALFRAHGRNAFGQVGRHSRSARQLLAQLPEPAERQKDSELPGMLCSSMSDVCVRLVCSLWRTARPAQTTIAKSRGSRGSTAAKHGIGCGRPAAVSNTAHRHAGWKWRHAVRHSLSPMYRAREAAERCA